MATKQKKKKENPAKKPARSSAKAFQAEPEEKIDLRALAKDERTHKMLGAVSLLLSLFLFTSLFSYLFVWKQDQAIVLNRGMGILFDDSIHASNLLGKLGAIVSHFLVFKAFGIASFLICTFFFVVGVNLLFRARVFSIWRNLKYVTLGLLVLSVSLSFVLGDSEFPFGGAVGDMIVGKMDAAMGGFGTGAVLVLLAAGYFIWQFNPSFKWPSNEQTPQAEEQPEEVMAGNEQEAVLVINDIYADKIKDNSNKGNSIVAGTDIVINFPEEKPVPTFELIEKDGEPELDIVEKIEADQPTPEKEIISEIMHSHEDQHSGESVKPPPSAPKPEKLVIPSDDGIELEIKIVPDVKEEESVIVENLPPYEPTLDLSSYKYPKLDLLDNHGSDKIIQDPAELEAHKIQIINTLRNYSIEIQKISATVGPTVTLYEIVPAPGVRISKIKNLEDDIALSLAALGIRIIAPIPGKGTIGIEVPNVRKTMVSMKSLLSSEKFQINNFSLPIAIGKKIDNENYIVDLATMPHLLMAGATGQGKSVGVNAILVSLLYKKHPSQLKFVMIDPKKVELSIYRKIEKHFLAKLPGEDDAIITDTKKVVNTLNALCIEMDNRYDLLKEAHARNIKEYNEKFIKRKLNPEKGHQYLPFIVLVIDEFADLIMTAGKEIEMPIARLAQLARAVGIHLIIATQRPSVNIITGTIKANFPARIAFKVSSKIDSRTILDTGGAEQLIGKGDMLISNGNEVTRLQCAFVDTPEVEKIVDYIGDQRGYPQAFLLPEYVDEKEMEGRDFDMNDRDSLFEDAARLIVQNQIGSTSLLQRRMKLGYNRAGRLMDQLEAAGIVGPSQGSKARDVLIKTDMELQQHLDLLG